MHGATDPLVPVYQSAGMYEALQAAGAEAIFLPLAGHGHSVYWDHKGQFSFDNILHIFNFFKQALSLGGAPDFYPGG
jgi:fermentation-respiration switch protein FrsA (DUF1100 family)